MITVYVVLVATVNGFKQTFSYLDKKNAVSFCKLMHPYSELREVEWNDMKMVNVREIPK